MHESFKPALEFLQDQAPPTVFTFSTSAWAPDCFCRDVVLIPKMATVEKIAVRMYRSTVPNDNLQDELLQRFEGLRFRLKVGDPVLRESYSSVDLGSDNANLQVACAAFELNA